ncbi:hybrid sensor histidine kinase/response regulator [Psychromonas aquimarina]|uniref:hybrid sensor histidine kinase/response regulator n=1 Tax=Psychromonas aquimarina TaxID=444919 RepID=UPI0004207F3F|nr:hybrid sensor histidine kinase/response regulator [Psychromonas aquimarina]
MNNNLVTIKGSKILIVDDKQENLELLTQILEAEGFEIAFAVDGEQAIKIANLFLPHLILLDVMMPGIDGFETCRRLKSLNDVKEIPVIFVTGKAGINDIVEAFNAGGVDYVTKPIRHEEILARVNTHLQLQALISLRDELISALRDQNIELEKMSSLKDEQLETAVQFNHIGELVGELTHEVATPLGIMNTAMSTLDEQRLTMMKQLDENHLSKKNLTDFIEISGEVSDIVNSNLNHAINLVNSFKKIVVGEFSHTKTEFVISTYLNDIKHTLLPKFKRCTHTLKIECAKPIVFTAETGALSQVLINLISNALIHAFSEEQNGSIQLVASETDDAVILDVIDDGKGLDESSLNKIFDKYYSTRSGKGGSGLGLYIVKKLVENNLNGNISVKSSLGNGTHFSISMAKTT